MSGASPDEEGVPSPQAGEGGARRMMDGAPAGLGRALVAVGAAASTAGGLILSGGGIEAGEPVPLFPVLALFAGAIVFGWGIRLASGPERAPPELAEPAHGAGRAIPAAGRAWIVSAALLGAGVAAAYAVAGYHPLLFAGWAGSLALATFAVWPSRRLPARVALEAGEAWFLGAVLVASAALLLPYLGRIPYEISTDEIYSVGTVRSFAEGSARDAFGLVSWWGLPAMWFAAVARAAPLTGTSIEAVRLVTAVTALLVPVPFYLWVRTLHGRRVAIVATALLAFSHAFIGWGRLALNQNSPLLLLALALALLALGLSRRDPVGALWGGICLGLGFYTYPSGQIAVFIWLAALGAWWIARAESRGALLHLGGLSLLGFGLAVAPMLVNVLLDFGDFTQRARAVAITNPEAIERLAALWQMEDPGAIVRENVKRALLGLNAPFPYVTYYNPRHAFLDPATGILAWLGLGLAVWRPRNPGLSLAAIGFLAIYATGFLTEGAPAHGRLLIALPFVAVLGAEALVRLSGAFVPDRPLARRSLRWGLAAGLLGIILLNLSIFRGFVRHQMSAGRNDAVTAIGRTLGVGIELDGPFRRYFGQGRTWDPRHRVFFYSEEDAPLFRWGDPADWHAWISFFADSALVHRVENLDGFRPGGSADIAFEFWNRATLFLPTRVWEREEARLMERFPRLEARAITPNRRITVVDIPR